MNKIKSNTVNNVNKILNINKIVNVYQQSYKNAPGGGIGDFIRGSFFLLQFCIFYNIRFDIDYNNHPISKFLYKKNNTVDENIMYNTILYYYPDNNKNDDKNNNVFINDFVNYLNKLNTSNTKYIFSNNYPIKKINDFERQFILNKFLPNEELICSINSELTKINIIEKQFSVIHIRLGDSILLDNEKIQNNTLLKILNIILKNIEINNKKKYLLLSDSNDIKIFLKQKFENLVINLNKIVHLASKIDEYESVKSTLTDFFIMSKSNYIYSLSIYDHGSGFSEYCSVLNNIPYTFYKI